VSSSWKKQERCGGLAAADGVRMSVQGAHASAGSLWSIGVIRSTLTDRHEAPKQGSEGAPDAWLDVHPLVADGLLGIKAGDELIVITWLHQSRRDVLQVHPRKNPNNPLTGVFATRSPDRPNPSVCIPSSCAKSTDDACVLALSRSSTEHRSSTSSQSCDRRMQPRRNIP
jgi:hypothetical protein